MQGPNGELTKSLNADTQVKNKKAISVFPIAIKNFPNVMTMVPIDSVRAYVAVCFSINIKALYAEEQKESQFRTTYT